MKKRIVLQLITVFALFLGQFVWAQGQTVGNTRRAIRGFDNLNLDIVAGYTQNRLSHIQSRPGSVRPGAIAVNGNNYQVMFAKRRTTIKYGTRKPRGSYTGPTQITNTWFPPLPPGAPGAILILDVSGSMDMTFGNGPGSRWDVMVTNAEAFLKSISTSKKFNMYLFDSQNHVMPKGKGPPQKMVNCSKQNKADAVTWLKTSKNFTTRGSTMPLNSFQDALALAAKSNNPPAIYFLADGDFGFQEAAVLAAVQNANPKPVIHVTAVGPDITSSINEMKAIAAMTGGTFTQL